MKVGQRIQQGDVLIKKIADGKIPEYAQKADTKILQMSETTGHHHHFEPKAKVEVYESPEEVLINGVKTITPNFGKFIEVKEDTFLFHGKGFDQQPAKIGRGDHDALRIPAGTYEIDIVREYDYDSQEVRRVID